MSEIRSIVELWQQTRPNIAAPSEAPSASVLVTLVRVAGSSYRKPGARLLSCAHTSVGSISGGCLEGEVLRKAAWLTHSGAALQRYSTLFDDTSEIPYGLGCGGVVDLLLEPLHLPETQALLSALAQSLTGERLSVLTLFPTTEPLHPMQRIVLNAAGTVLFASESLSPLARTMLTEQAQKHLSLPAPLPTETTLHIDGVTRTAFAEVLAPPQRLFVFGAGNDAQPLVQLAHLLGWRVSVVDGRSSLARADRFPQASSVILLPKNTAHTAAAIASLRLAPDDAAVLLTHSYEQDRALLPHLLPLGLRYLGLLGARHRSRLLLTETAAQLCWTPQQCLARLHTPVGLPLGGDTPEAVALAIVAEIQSVLHGRALFPDPTANASLLDSATPYIPAACPLEIAEEASNARSENIQAMHD